MYLENIDSRRKDGRIAVQWHATDTVLVTLDDNYSSDDEHDARWQRSTWFGAVRRRGAGRQWHPRSFDATGPTDFKSPSSRTTIS